MLKLGMKIRVKDSSTLYPEAKIYIGEIKGDTLQLKFTGYSE